tara:strand:- start:577 stop:741 length:165 start_codon:yes stop_codon:yes gene_type:complete
MKHIIICKECGDIVRDDSHFEECSEDCFLFETSNDDFGQAIEDTLRRWNVRYSN